MMSVRTRALGRWHPIPPLAVRVRRLSAFPSDVIPSPSPSPTSSSSVTQERRHTSYLYLDSVFPIRIHLLDFRYLLAEMEADTLLSRVRSLIPLDSSFSTRVESVIPRTKDGGAWVKFSFVLPSQPFVEDAVEPPEELDRARRTIEREVQDAIGSRGYKEWFVSRESRAFLVEGRPWNEDMNRFVNRELRVEFEGPDIPQEELYDLFRKFGKIHDIVPPSPSSKDMPRAARVIYTSTRSAAAARNCLHAYTYASPSHSATPTTLRILFVERMRPHYIQDWAAAHPRIMLPLIVALLGGISWAVFDPVREFFIRNKVEGTWDSDRWAFVRWVKRETLGRLGLGAKDSALVPSTGIEREREQARTQVSTWLRDTPDTFIVITGPRGSGKTALVNQVTRDHTNVLTIDCATICKNARSDTKLVSELASAVGYYPQFVLAASLNNMIDLASVGLIGQKAGFSASLDAQLKQILEVTSSALKSIASERNVRLAKASLQAQGLWEHTEERATVLKQMEHEGVKDGRLDAIAGNGVMSELGCGLERPYPDGVVIMGPRSSQTVKAFLEPDPKDSDCTADEIGGLPVIVIKGFAAKGEAKQEVLWDVLAEWAAVLVENQVAHVIFCSDSIAANKPLAKALPNKPFNSIALNDASPDSALQYIEAKLLDSTTSSPDSPSEALSPESKAFIARLGGRQTDLELLVQKIKAGMAPEEAVWDIVDRSSTELRKNFFGDDDEEAKSFKWTRAQVWSLVTGLAENPELKYADVLVNPPFKSDEGALRALENAEMITIHHRDGRPSVIRPGRPVYRSAFQQLLADKVYAASIRFQINASATAAATADLNAASKSLIELSGLFGNGRWAFGGGSTVPQEIEVRVTGLLKAMRKAEVTLAGLEKEKDELLKVLAEDV